MPVLVPANRVWSFAKSGEITSTSTRLPDMPAEAATQVLPPSVLLETPLRKNPAYNVLSVAKAGEIARALTWYPDFTKTQESPLSVLLYTPPSEPRNTVRSAAYAGEGIRLRIGLLKPIPVARPTQVAPPSLLL